MGKNIKVKVILPFQGLEPDPNKIWEITQTLWVDRATFDRLYQKKLVKIIEIKKEVYLK